MGAPMASNLLRAGVPLSVYNRGIEHVVPRHYVAIAAISPLAEVEA